MNSLSFKTLIFSIFCISFYSCTTSEIDLETPIKPITELVTYTNEVKEIIDTNCISCHASGGQASFLPLVTFVQVKNSAQNGSLISRMNSISSPMPQSGLLPAQTRAIIDKWKTDGFLEN